MKNSFKASVLAILTFMMAEGRASADVSSLPACIDDPTCVSLFERAKQQSKDGNADEALRLYKQAYELRADPRLLFSIARVFQKQSKWKEAASYYQSFVDSPLQADEQKQKAREYHQQCQQQIAEMDRAATEAEFAKRALEQNARQSSPESSPLKGQPETEGRRPSPIYSRWWFWVAIGGGAVAVSAITAGIVLGTRGSDADPNQTASRMLPANTLIITF